MEIDIVNVATDLGSTVNGCEYAPSRLFGYFEKDNRIRKIHNLVKPNVEKEYDKSIKKKNLAGVNHLNAALFKELVEIKREKVFPIVIGGDHSIGIATSLAQQKAEGNIGLIWISAHGDYNTFESSITGNIRGMSLATVNGFNTNQMTLFFDGNYIDPHKTVLIGTRDIDPLEYPNITASGIKMFSTKDIETYGVESVIEKALVIASGNNTNGVHVSYDLEIIDPIDAPGVSIPVQDGIPRQNMFKMLNILFRYKSLIKGFDLVEYNPMKDIDNKTYIIALNTLEKVINEMKS